MPEVPGNIQENLAYLELDTNSSRKPSRSEGTQDQFSNQKGSAGAHGEAIAPRKSSQYNTGSISEDYRSGDEPSFSPFPKLVNPPPNVPPTDSEKEAILEKARIQVLQSNDPDMQLAWAQDALAYVDVALANEQRLAEYRPARPSTPQVEHQLRVDSINIVSFLADQRHPKAEFMRGMWLEFGKFGFRQDKKEAFRCYSRAADKGYFRAEYRIGMQYEQSNDPAKALVHYKRGAEAGDSPSNYVSTSNACNCDEIILTIVFSVSG